MFTREQDPRHPSPSPLATSLWSTYNGDGAPVSVRSLPYSCFGVPLGQSSTVLSRVRGPSETLQVPVLSYRMTRLVPRDVVHWTVPLLALPTVVVGFV